MPGARTLPGILFSIALLQTAHIAAAEDASPDHTSSIQKLGSVEQVKSIQLIKMSSHTALGDKGLTISGDPRLKKHIRGLVVPLHHATISSRLQATIQTIGPGSGERFKKGDTLIDFDCAIHKAELMRADAQMRAADDSYRVKSELARNGTISKLQTVLARAELKKAEAERVLSAERVAYCTIKAPYDGRVVRRLANAHETVNFGDPLVEIVNDLEIELQLYVPSKWLPQLHIGTPFSFHVDETGVDLDAKIIAIGAWVDNVSQLIEIRATCSQAVEDTKITQATQDSKRSDVLLAGMSGYANFPHIMDGHANSPNIAADPANLAKRMSGQVMFPNKLSGKTEFGQKK